MSEMIINTTELNTEPFLFVGGNLAVDLVNTEMVVRRKRIDLLNTPQDVESWWQKAYLHYPEQEVVPDEHVKITYDTTLLETLKSFRTALRNIFGALVDENIPQKEDLDLLNHILKTGYVTLDLTQDGKLQPIYHTNNTMSMILLPIALSALQLIHDGERKRLHRCENSRCILFFYDTTRSATRRWCSLGCMDRARSIQRYKQKKQDNHLP